jgi:hypothetical protein
MAAGIPGRCRPAFRNESGRDSEMKAATYSDFKVATFSGFFGTVAGFVLERFPQGEERWTTTGQVSLHGHVEENIAREKVVHEKVKGSP